VETPHSNQRHASRPPFGANRNTYHPRNLFLRTFALAHADQA
jgi:hypothetical protein